MTARSVRACVIVLSAAVLATTQSVAGRNAELNPAERQTVESAVLAYQRGDPVSLLDSLSPLVAKVDDKKLIAVDELLASRASPSASAMLTEARLAMVQQSLTGKLPRPGVRESLLVLKEIDDQVQLIIQITRAPPALVEAVIPDTSAGFEKRLWEMHVLHSRLEVAKRMVEYMSTLANGYPKAQLAKLSEPDRNLVEAEPGTLRAGVAREVSDLEEREVELRLERLSFARNLLERPQLTAERFVAAFTADFDGRLIARFFDQVKKSRRQLNRDTLKGANTQTRLASERQRARALAGDLGVKAQLLFEGLHWWMRGRYGRGSEVGGLAKSEWAMRSPEGQFGLYMPVETPQPTDPALNTTERVPNLDRRHHYLWAIEDRRILENTPAFCGSGPSAAKIDFW